MLFILILTHFFPYDLALTTLKFPNFDSHFYFVSCVLAWCVTLALKCEAVCLGDIINFFTIGEINGNQIYWNERENAEPCEQKMVSSQCHCGEAGYHD